MDASFAEMMFEAIAEGVFTLDPDGHITAWNPAMESITGYPADDVIGRKCSILNFNRCLNRSCPNGALECGIFKQGAVDGKQCTLRHKDGFDIPVLKSARLVKDPNGQIKGIVESVTDLRELLEARERAAEADRRLGAHYRLGNIIGKSKAMQHVFTAIEAAARSDAAILVQGESGTGKELVAGAIHYNGNRASAQMITVNCSALSEQLLESELFGHVKGAFTGAIRDRKGRFEEAAGSTIFLDEIGEISPFIQVKLLRVLQEKEIERVGESRPRKIDIRIIAATRRDLYSLVKEGKFRDDLYYRLKVFPVQVPPLRQRREDIPLLVTHFLGRYSRKTGKEIYDISARAMRLLMDHPWPGNVRELENAVEHAFVLCEGTQLRALDLPVEIRQTVYAPAGDPPDTSATAPVRGKVNLTEEKLLKVLHECDWNKAEVGRRIGLSRTAIWKYMKKWDIPLKQPLPT